MLYCVKSDNLTDFNLEISAWIICYAVRLLLEQHKIDRFVYHVLSPVLQELFD